MTVSYNKLWKLLIDNRMMKKELKEKAELSSGTMSKLAKDEPVNLSVIIRICKALNCDIVDVLEIIRDK